MLRRIRGGAVVVAAIFAVVVAFCSAAAAAAGVPQPPEARSGATSWPYPDHDPSNSRLAAGSPITAKDLSRLTTAWKVSATGGLPTSPIVVGHNVFVEDQVGEIFDINLTSGRVVWKSPSNGYSVGPEGVAVGWGKVFGVTPTSLFALDENTGRQLVVDAADPHCDRRCRRSATGDRARRDRLDRARERQRDLYRR